MIQKWYRFVLFFHWGLLMTPAVGPSCWQTSIMMCQHLGFGETSVIQMGTGPALVEAAAKWDKQMRTQAF